MSIVLLRGKKRKTVIEPIPIEELLFWDDFSSGDFTKTLNGCNWFGGNSVQVVSLADVGLPMSPIGSRDAIEFAFIDTGNPGDFDAMSEISFNFVDSAEAEGFTKIYLRYYMYYPDGEIEEAGPEWVRSERVGDKNKFIRFYDVYNRSGNTIAFGASTRGTASNDGILKEGDEVILLETGGNGFYASPGEGEWAIPTQWTSQVNRGRWIKVEIEVEMPTYESEHWNGADGVLRIRMDNITIVETTTGTMSAGDVALKSMYLMGYQNGYMNNHADVQRMYITDFAVSTTGRVDGDIDPFFSEIFEDGQYNDANGFEWTSNAYTYVTTESPYKGTHSLEFLYGAGTPPNEGWSEQRFDMGRYTREFWIDYKLWVPDNFEHVNQPPTYAENNKFLMVWRDVYSDIYGGTQQIGFEYMRDAGTGNSLLRTMARSAVEDNGQYTGTVSTSGSTTLVGSGTLFTSEISVGHILRSGTNELIGVVASIADNTHLEVENPFEVTLDNDPFYNIQYLTDSVGSSPQPLLITSADNTGPLRKGRWNQIRVGARLSSARTVADGFIKIIVNGHVLKDLQNMPLWNVYDSPADAAFRNGYFLGYVNSGFSVETKFFIDDVHFYLSDPGQFDSETRPHWNTVRNFNAGVDDTPANEGGDGFDDIAGASYYTNEQVREGSLACKCSISSGSEGNGTWGGLINLNHPVVKGQRLWTQVWFYIPGSFVIETPGNGSLKTIRFRQYTAADANAGFLDIQLQDDDETISQWRMIKEGQDDWQEFGDPNSFPRDQWVRVTVCLDVDDQHYVDGGTSRVRVWQGTEKIADSLTLDTIANATDRIDALYLFTYWNGNAPQTQSLYVDDIRMSTELLPEWAEDLIP